MGSLAGGVLADATFNSSSPTITAHYYYKEGKGSLKKVRKLVTEKLFTSK